ncbi:MAG: hypothetical protein AAF196_16805 [Planctomycetota bacterium]
MRDDRPHFATGLALAALAVFVAWGAWVLTSTDEVGAAAPETERASRARLDAPLGPQQAASDQRLSPSFTDSDSANRRSSDVDGEPATTSKSVNGSVVVRVVDEEAGGLLSAPYLVDVEVSNGESRWANLVDGEAEFAGLPFDRELTIRVDAFSVESDFGARVVRGPTVNEPSIEVACAVRVRNPWIPLRVMRADGGVPSREVFVFVHRGSGAPFEKRLLPDSDGRVTVILPETYVGQDVFVVVQEMPEPDVMLSHRHRLDALAVGAADEVTCVLYPPDILVEGVFDLSRWIAEPDSAVAVQRPWLAVQRRFGEGAWEQCTRVVLEDGGVFRLYGLHDAGASYRVAPILRSGVLEDQAVPFEPYTRGLLVRVRPPESVPR